MENAGIGKLRGSAFLLLLACLPGFGQAATDRQAVRDQALKVLREELETAERWVKVHAAEGLLQIGYPQGVEEAFRKELAEYGEESEYRVGIWRVMARNEAVPANKKEWVDRIKTVFLDASSPDRIHAVETLGKLGCELDEEELEQVKAFTDQPGATFALWVLSQHGDEQAERRLAALRNSKDTVRRLRAEFCLSQLTPPTREEWLAAGGYETASKKLQSEEAGERLKGCRTLAQLGEPFDVEKVLPLLEDEDADVRVHAAIALLRLERKTGTRMGWIDWSVIACYAAAMLLIGWYYSRKTKTTEDYLLGGRNIKSWTVGLSLFASLLSTISYMAYPGEIIKHGPMILAGCLSFPLVVWVVGWFIIPAFMKVRVTSANELLERELGVSVRMLGTFLFLAIRLMWMGMIIYMTVEAVLGPVLGLEERYVPLVCALLGLVTVIYTSSGGLRAVVLTDVIQTFILFAGAILSIMLISLHFKGFGWFPTVWASTWDRPVILPDPAARVTLVGSMLMTFFWFICTAGSDQIAVQRYLATRDARAARSAFTTSMTADILVKGLLMLLGFALLAYFAANPHELADGTTVRANADELFPRFIVRGLPVGMTGLVVAALLAAAMSSLSSGLNSSCTVVTVDLFERLSARKLDDRSRVKRARWVSWGMGIVVVVLSLMVDKVEGNFLEVVNKAGNLLISPLFVVFFAALFLPWVNAVGTWAGAAASIAVAVAIAFFEILGLSFLWIIPSSLVSGIVVASAVSLLTGQWCQRPSDISKDGS